MKENRTFKFVIEVVRRDQFIYRIMSMVYTFDITTFYGHIGFNFFPAEFDCCLYLYHLHNFLPNSRFSQSFIYKVPIKAYQSAYQSAYFLKMPKGKALAVRASWEGLNAPYVHVRDLSGPEDVANWAEVARCAIVIQRR